MRPRPNPPRRPAPAGAGGVGGAGAADRAAAAALHGTADPRLLVVFGSGDLPAAGRAVADVAPAGVPVVGCTAPGCNDVVVAALGGDGFSVSTALVGTAEGERPVRFREAGAEAPASLGH